jgi:hypothetical protein
MKEQEEHHQRSNLRKEFYPQKMTLYDPFGFCGRKLLKKTAL